MDVGKGWTIVSDLWVRNKNVDGMQLLQRFDLFYFCLGSAELEAAENSVRSVVQGKRKSCVVEEL